MSLVRTPGIIELEGLTLVSGMPSTEIIEKLKQLRDRAAIGLPSVDASESGAYYFKETGISLEARDRSIIRNEIGEPTSSRKGRGWGKNPVWTYLAKYEITPEFSMAQLNGVVRFDEGRLVERTFLYFRNS